MADLLNKTNEAPVATEEQAKEKPKKVKEVKKQYLESNNMNFFERYEVVVEGKKNDVDISAYKTPILIVAVLLLVLLVLSQGMNIFTKVQIKSLNKYINEPTNVSAYNDAVKVKSDIDGATLQKANLESMMVAIKSYPNLDRAFFDSITLASTANGVKTLNYGYISDTGMLSVSCQGQTTQNVSDFVRALVATGLFTSVNYNGFSGAADSGYSFSVSCLCKGSK